MKETRTDSRREQGFALLMTVLILLLLTSLGFASLNIVGADQQVAGYLARKKLALQAADAGVAKALETLQTTGTPTVPTTDLADSSVFPHGQPRFREDPNVTPAIDNLGLGALPGFNLAIGQNGTPQFQVQYWKINVQGEAPGGTTARVEFATGNLVTNN